MTSFYKLKSLLIGLGLTLFLSSCGQDVCVAGIGKCEVPKELRDKQSTSPNPSRISLDTVYSAVITDEISLGFSKSLKLTGLGGKAPYKYSVSSEAGTGKVDENSGEFTSPPNAGKPILAKVKITDSNSKSVEIEIDIR